MSGSSEKKFLSVKIEVVVDIDYDTFKEVCEDADVKVNPIAVKALWKKILKEAKKEKDGCFSVEDESSYDNDNDPLEVKERLKEWIEEAVEDEASSGEDVKPTE